MVPSLKVFPPNQRNHGVFLDQDLRLKSLLKDVDCSDLAVREAWESFVSVSCDSSSPVWKGGVSMCGGASVHLGLSTECGPCSPVGVGRTVDHLV